MEEKEEEGGREKLALSLRSLARKEGGQGWKVGRRLKGARPDGSLSLRRAAASGKCARQGPRSSATLDSAAGKPWGAGEAAGLQARGKGARRVSCKQHVCGMQRAVRLLVINVIFHGRGSWAVWCVRLRCWKL